MFLSINKFGGVPMYESLIAKVQQKGTDAVFLRLKAAWLNFYDSEIVVKTESKLDTEKERVRKKFREKRNQLNKQPVFENYFQPDPKINYDYEKQSEKKVRDQSSREKQKSDFQKLREQQELNKREQQELNALSYSHYFTKIEAEFIQKFEDCFWFKGENFKQKCNQQIKQLDLKEVLNNFFSRHGWLKTQGNDYVAEKFLRSFLIDKLLNGLKISSNRPYPFSATLSCEIDKDQLKKMIEGYPYTNTNFYTVINYRDTLSTQLDDGKPIVNHALKRIDALDNQRLLRQLDLKKNTQLIHDCAKDVLRSDVIIEEKLAQKEQDWAGDDVRYPLAAQVPGIQQQLQQEVTQEFQQEQEQEQEEEQEQEQEIALYSGDISSLIDRNNIDAKYKDSWFEIPESIKTLSGWEGEKLSQLFSLWVGSQENATHVIEKIHPQAIQEIMNYAPQFRLGLSKDNLPAGFYLTYLEKDKGLVLCFDKKR